jgi:hypothetical protein
MKALWNLTSAAALGTLLALACLEARGQVAQQGPYFYCGALAASIRLMADFRDAGADVERVVKMALEHNSDEPAAHRAVIEREIRRVWTEERPGPAAALAVFKRCQAQLGDMGREVH